MVKWLLQKIVGSKHTREINKIWPLVRKINAIEEELQSLTDDQLREKTANWQGELRAMEQKVDDEIDQWRAEKEAELIAGNENERIGYSSTVGAESELLQARRDLEEQARRKKLERLGDVHDEQSAYLEKIMPEAVSQKRGFKGYKSVNYNCLVGLLVETVKNQNNRMKQMEKKLEETQEFLLSNVEYMNYDM